MPPKTIAMIIQIVPVVFMLLIFYFLILRPQQKQQKKHRDMLTNLKRNDEIVTSAGIHGTIVAVKEKTFVLRIDEDAKMEIDKAAVAYVIKQKQE